MTRVSTAVAKTRKKLDSKPLLRLLGGRGAATLALGAALSIGGVTEAFDNVHFLVEKSLDSVQVVRQNGENEKVVAKLGGFAGNTVFKLARVLPDRFVSRELSLFDDQWFPQEFAGKSHQTTRDVFFEEMARINDAIRREFFSGAMPYGDLIHEKAGKYNVDPALVAAVIEQESRFMSRAQSHVGAKGLMQLMPRTGRWMGARDLYDPEQNIDAGVKYIKYLQGRFDGNLTKTIAAYNAGEGNVIRYRGVPPFGETRTYVKKVMSNYNKRTRQLQKFEEQRGGSVPEADGTLMVRWEPNPGPRRRRRINGGTASIVPSSGLVACPLRCHR
ncbi:MAG: lytic transglycosylase domain-containing protein [Thermoanaerobaculia bacterium]|nr:lytic transglycosylase domain-containing protein [Thermoanaerobaculia bacterium]